ncbi:basic immunoglobulin-like variable motif-containing protein [Ptychodera flava]|uniref:basic immunoglobulin-like variable motif-containing protein n=1 Tax=Ptychodera flava TaxID=63121 RepID=UPI00396A1A67
MGNVTSQSDSDETTGMPTEESDTLDDEERANIGRDYAKNRHNIVSRKQNNENLEQKEPGVVTPLLEDEDEAKVKRERVLAWEIDVTGWDGNTKPFRRYRSTRQKGIRRLKAAGEGSTNVKDQYAPPIVNATQRMIAERKVLDVRRWFCISRPQYSKSCGISSLVSCWNYLYSTIGVGSLQPITQEEALTVLGFKPPFGEIRFGPFTGNATLMRWFTQLNEFYKVRGRSYYLYKPHGKGRTMGRTSEEALRLLKAGLRDPNITYIYHCQNHYFCPIGFESVPTKAIDAYSENLADDEVESWILIGDTSRRHPGIQCVRWEDIVKDLNLQSPDYVNIRKVHLGQQKRKTKKVGGNLHCIMAYQKSFYQGVRSSDANKSGDMKDDEENALSGVRDTDSYGAPQFTDLCEYGLEEEVVVDIADADSSAEESISSDD